MRLYSTNAVKLLHEKAKTLRSKPDSWRCLHIDFADAGKSICSDGLRTHVVTNIIKDLLEWEVGNIYLCDDGDVFILFQGKAKEIIDRLGCYFQDLGASTTASDGLFTVYDLSTRWDDFWNLCESKLAQLKPVATSVTADAPKPNYKPLRAMDDALLGAAIAKRPGRKRLTVQKIMNALLRPSHITWYIFATLKTKWHNNRVFAFPLCA